MFDVSISALVGGRLEADLERLRPTHVLSLIDVAHPELDLARHGLVEHVVLRVEDTVAGRGPDSFAASHLTRVVDLVARMEKSGPSARLLVHCHHGQSRSPAAAFIALAIALGPGQEREAFKRVVRAAGGRPWPNRLIVEVADEGLGRAGALVRELDRYRDRFRPGS
jgi:predicted protein tyrosine phosphatase